MNKYYAGIGSRETPNNILELMYGIAQDLYLLGWTLRSGGAPGADQAFEWGVADKYKDDDGWPCHEIYLPWPSFEKDNRSWLKPRLTKPGAGADVIAELFHPRYRYLSRGAKLLMSRNTHQIYGQDIFNPDFSSFVVCWTKGAKGGGGTGQAIRIANGFGIPVFDLADPTTPEKLKEKIVNG